MSLLIWLICFSHYGSEVHPHRAAGITADANTLIESVKANCINKKVTEYLGKYLFSSLRFR